MIRKNLVYALSAILAQCGCAYAQAQQTAANTNSADADRPRLVVQLGHAEASSATFSPDGRFLVTSTVRSVFNPDADLCLWEVASGREIRRFAGGWRPSFSADGHSLLVICGRNARLYEVATGREIRRFDDNPSELISATFTPDGFVLTKGFNETVRLWDAATAQEVRSFEKIRVIVADGRFLLRLLDDDSAQLLDPITGQEVRRFRGPRGWIQEARTNVVEFSPDLRYVLTWRTPGPADISSNRISANLRELDSDREIQRFGETQYITTIGFSPDGRAIIAAINTVSNGYRAPKRIGDEKYAFRFYDIAAGKEAHSFDGSMENVASITVSPDGRLLLTTGSGPAHLFDIATGHEIRRFDGYANKISAMMVSADGRFMAVASSEFDESTAIRDLGRPYDAALWDLSAGQQAQVFKGHTRYITAIDLSADGQVVLTGSYDHTARLWEATTGREIWKFTGQGAIKSVAYSPNGQWALVGEDNGTVRILNAVNGQETRRAKHSDWVRCLAFSPDGRHMLTGGSNDSVAVWDLATWTQVFRLRGDKGTIYAARFSPDSRYVLTGSTMYLWDVATGKQVRQFEIEGPERKSATAEGMAFSSDGRLLLSAAPGRDNTVRLWDAATGKELKRLVGHTSKVTSVAFSHDARFGISASDDNTIRVWDLSTGQTICQVISFRDGTWVVVDSEGRFDTNNLDEINGLHWVMPDEPMHPLPLEIFMRDYYEPRLFARILGGETFNPVRRLSSLNRVQPGVKITAAPKKDSPDTITVTVEVARAEAEFKRGKKGQDQTGVYDLRLFRNNQLVGYWPPASQATLSGAINDQLDDEQRQNQELHNWRRDAEIKLTNGKFTRNFDVKVPHQPDLKQVEFSAYAFNEDRVKSQTARKLFDLPAGLEPVKGRAYLISVGVNAYENPDWNLRFAANDARRAQKVLSEKLSQTGQYEEIIQVQLISDYEEDSGALTEKSASKDNFRALLDLLSGKKVDAQRLRSIPNAGKIRQTRPEDLVLISFSGHGYADRGGRFYFFPYDIGPGKGRRVTQALLKRCISSEELSLWLRDVDAREMVLVVDACHSAATVEEEGFKPGPMGSRGLGQLAYDKGMRILAASQADDRALESDQLRQGLLGYALIHDGIEARQADNSPRDGKITLKEWLRYGVERVPKLNQEVEIGRVQSFGPDVAGRGTKVIVIRKRGSAKGTSIFQQPTLFDFARKRPELILVSEGDKKL